jgi:hypothetical protein
MTKGDFMITWHLSLRNEDLLWHLVNSIENPVEYNEEEKKEIKKEILSRMEK